MDVVSSFAGDDPERSRRYLKNSRSGSFQKMGNFLLKYRRVTCVNVGPAL
jgi:hypothetical protein